MFDRKVYMKEYYSNRYKQRKEEGRCTACGEKLTKECTTLLCVSCRKKNIERNIQQWQRRKRKAFQKIIRGIYE
jgi:hypothetical protein